ncbi:MAG: hypothetical protein FD161_3005 [Limisphaerales bacterium]|nr:MAG: hypothetical protein FD161_3005 [Limisphaerales bacterium]KAG0508118.1 MAG: hypothetical protein E1N63_2712 [Limisphaerales bacterium]TXT53029.1 MAG: hypothetical protein FD140_137 [Limisphaerales bacterium]
MQTPALRSALTIYDFPPDVQEVVRELMHCLAVLEESGRQAALRLCADYPHLAGLSIGNLYKKLRAWNAAGRNPVALVDKRRWADLWVREEREAVLPRGFITLAAGRMLGNQRKDKPAWKQLILEWRRWHATGQRCQGWEECGYDRCPPPGPNGRHPLGWSYENLRRRAQNSRPEKAIARIGTSAAKGCLPCVPGTREGARFLEWVMFDDVKLDRRVIVPPHGPVDMAQFGALDLASGVYLKFGQRPVLPRENGSKEFLSRRDFLFLVAALFEEHGYPLDYRCHLILERGTATLSAAEARVLYDASGGQIVVGYTGMNGETVCAWEEKPAGNSNGKAHIESFHNALHNACGHLSGQAGKDRNHAPQLEHGRAREAAQLMKLGALLPPDLRAAIPFGYASPQQCYRETLEIVDALNRREGHECEGFEQLPVWRMKGSRELWRPLAELAGLPEDVQALGPDALKTLIEWSARVETPHERMVRLRAGANFARLPEQIWPRFYDDGHALARVTPRGWLEVGPRKNPVLFGPDDPAQSLPEGTEVLAYFAQHDPDRAHLTVNGRYAGSWNRLRGVKRGDQPALREAIARKQRFLQATIASVQGKSGEALVREAWRAEQLAVLAQAAVPVLARAADQRLQEISTPGAEGLQVMTSGRTATRAALTENDRAIRGAGATEDDLAAATSSELAPAAEPVSEEELSGMFAAPRTENLEPEF